MPYKHNWFVLIVYFLFLHGALSYGVIDIDEIHDGTVTHIRNIVDCQSAIHRGFCAQFCKRKNMKSLCFEEQCYCQELDSNDADSSEKATSKASKEISLEVWKPDPAAGSIEYGSSESPEVWKPKFYQMYDYELNFEDTSKQNNPVYDLLLGLRPTLRHHIAHFCPNLDIARQCIMKCMTQGKPAFCGKDHVCYCGHKYSSHDSNPKVDVNDVKSQFKDLYDKYFGSKYEGEQKMMHNNRDMNNDISIPKQNTENIQNTKKNNDSDGVIENDAVEEI